MSDGSCPHPECSESIPPGMFACRGHWFSLPKELRAKIIWRNYRSNNLAAILSGYDEAEAWWTR